MTVYSDNTGKSKSVTMKFAVVLCLLLFAVQMASAACKGTLYFKAPSTWKTVYIALEQKSTKIPATAKKGDYYEFDLSKAASQNWNKDVFGLTNYDGPFNSGDMVTDKYWNATGQIGETSNIECPGEGNQVFVLEDPTAPGTTYVSTTPPDAKTLYILIPDEDDSWMTSAPMVRSAGDSPEDGTMLIPDESRCGWYYISYFNAEPVDDLIIYNSDGEEFGVNGAWEVGETMPIPLKTMFEDNEADKLFFIPSEANWPDDVSSAIQDGWFTSDLGATGKCSFNLAAVIYDTDVAINDLFSVYQGDESNLAKNCLGVRTEIVKDELGKDNKPQLNVGSSNAKKCFDNDEDLFNTLFNYTPDVNEVVCYDLPFTRSSDGRWAFDSDKQETDGFLGGFYPVEDTDDNSVITLNGKKLGPTKKARKKRTAEGPVPATKWYNMAKGLTLDQVCAGPGWDDKRAMDCDGYLAESDIVIDWDWGWKKRWHNGGANDGGEAQPRNQHFCFESHATFTYRGDEVFTFRGDDDIWVFIGGHLAVDNGGAHLAAPGYVDLPYFAKKHGMEIGKEYALDIFFCDRRTTQSNVIIKTNMYIQQSTGLKTGKSKPDSKGNVTYNICWEETGGGSCADVALGSAGSDSKTKKACGADIEKYNPEGIKYVLVSRSCTVEMGKKTCEEDEKGTYEEYTKKGVYKGGIDLSNLYEPKINTSKLSGLAPGSYKLWIIVGDTKTPISIRVKGTLDVANQTVTYNPIAGDEVSKYYEKGTKWEFVGKALAGSRVPVYISAISDKDIDLLSAVGQNYTLSAPGANIYLKKTGDAVAKFPRTIDDTGVDTLWLEVPFANMKEKEQTITAKVKALEASIKVYMPELKFVRNGEFVTRDPEKDEDGEDYFNWMGSEVELQLAIYNPITKEICTECGESFVVVSTDASPRVSANIGPFKDGLASVGVISRKIYYPDSTAFITVNFKGSEDVTDFQSTYDHMFFREPPCPYPTLVEIFDGRGAAPKGNLRIPEPLHAENKQYMDGIGDSLVVSYNRLFGKDDSGVVPEDSLPNFICLTWDDNKNFNLEKYSFNQKYPRGSEYGGKPVKYKGRDSLITCSDTIGRAQILEAFKRVGKATRVDEDTKESVEYNYLTFGGLTLSKDVKTYDDGTTSKKVNSWASYEDRGVLNISSFDMGVTERIPPVILKAVISVNSANDAFDDIKFTFSEPLQFKKDADKSKALSYYVFSAATIDPAKYPMTEARYLTPASLSPMAVGPEMTTANLSYQHKKGKELQPTPQNGDYVRFAMNGVEDLLGNSPTDYNAALPSPWTTITGEARSYIVTVPYSTINPNDPVTQEYMKNKTITTVGFFDNVHANADSIRAAKGNTVGHLIMTDMANLFDQYQLMDSTLTPADVYLTYEVYYFTHLGSFVAKSEGKIRCDDASYFGEGEDCTTNPGYFYIGWTGVSNDGRLAGTSAYVSKFTSAVVLKKKKAGKEEETNTFGFRRINK